MAAMTGIAGSAKIGKNCLFGGQCGVVGHITVADHTSLAAQSGVRGNVKEEGKTLMGTIAFDYHEYMRAYAAFKSQGKKK